MSPCIRHPRESRRQAFARAILNLRSIRGTSSYRRFVIIGVARTGSTLLTGLLNAHSQALVFGELFRSLHDIGWDIQPFLDCQGPRLLELHRREPVTFLRRHIFRRWPSNYAAVGFKLFYYHARTGAQIRVWEHLAADTNICILHIKRRSLLDQYYSLQLAHKTQVWATQRLHIEKPPLIRLDVEECRQHFASVRAGEEECEMRFRGHAIKDLYYEDLVANQDREMDDVQGFLGLQREKLKPNTVRQRTRPLSELIANYEELRNAFPDALQADSFRRRAS